MNVVVIIVSFYIVSLQYTETTGFCRLSGIIEGKTRSIFIYKGFQDPILIEDGMR
ncbi:hypothetical protein L698_05525 [Streptococcus oralis subsp. tigurinus 2426]|uniref:Uncharacterized protein n=1 Tax=Streptococcus oralis subsp. tigurinus 2426 TaxID=1333865 RepID=S9RAJ5_STROR|nr:hypothetical protein L698_05525 [Streptococcus oralis subsp. tigurinus 2426]